MYAGHRYRICNSEDLLQTTILKQQTMSTSATDMTAFGRRLTISPIIGVVGDVTDIVVVDHKFDSPTSPRVVVVGCR